MHRTFEARVTGGLAQWITCVRFEPLKLTADVGLTHHPEYDATERIVRLIEVGSVRSDWFDQEDAYRETVLGVDEDHLGEAFEYRFHTDQRQLAIRTKVPATIVDCNDRSQ